MRVRTLLAVTLTMFALPALAVEPPRPLPATSAPGEDSVRFEARVLTVPVGFCERHGVELDGDAVLTAAQVRALLEAAQAHRDAMVKQFPRVTADDGQKVTLSNCADHTFTSSVEAVKVKRQAVFVPKSSTHQLGDVLTIDGHLLADQKRVCVRATLTRKSLVGNVDLLPVVTQIKPIFEGGSKGTPVPFTQFVQAPEFKTEKVEKCAIVPSGGTFVLGGWKEAGDKKAQREVVTLVTVTTGSPAPARHAAVLKVKLAIAPLGITWTNHAAQKPVEYRLRNIAAADAAHALNTYLDGKKLNADVIAEAVTNTVYVSAEPELQKRLGTVLAALDVAPKQVVVQAMFVQVPRGFVKNCGLDEKPWHGAKTLTLSARELGMLTAFVRNAKGSGKCAVLADPCVCTTAGRPCCVQIGQDFPVETVGVVKLAGGAVAVESKIQNVPVGIMFEVTPKVSADGNAIGMTGEFQNTTVMAGAAVAGRGEPVPVFNTQKVVVKGSVRTGETLVVATSGKEYETLLILTPAVVK